MAANQALDRLNRPKAFSRWTPLWGMLGIGLPLTFAGQVRPATMFLRASELVPLYATEWILLGLFGLFVAGPFAILDMIASKLRRGVEPGAAAKTGFAIVIAVSFFLCLLTWIESLPHAPSLPNLWTCVRWFLFLFAAPIGIVIARGFFRIELATFATVARLLTLLGSVSLLSLPFFSGTTPQAYAGPLIAGVGTDSKLSAASRPNIVLISVDTLAAEHLIPYGSQRQTSPDIAEFSSGAIVFKHFYANSNYTTPGIASILTGVPPWTHRALQLQGHANPTAIAESLPARLHEAGYLTAYFSSNPWAGASRQGFSAYFDHEDSDLDWMYGPCLDALTNHLPYLCAAATNPLISISYAVLLRVASATGGMSLNPHSDLEQIVARATRWISGVERRPVFVWVHFFPPHAPYAAPKPWLGQFDPSPEARGVSSSVPAHFFDASSEPASRITTLEARYDESIAYLDYYFGQLISAIHQKLGPNTAILLTADHGESFGHGYGDHGGVMLYEELIHVPLIVKLPNATAATLRRDDPAAQIDLAPTIAAIAGVAASPNWAGRSLLEPPNSSEPRTIFAMNFEQNPSRGHLTTGAVAALQSNWKLVRFFGEPHYTNMPPLQTQLFDLAEDPHEHRNLAAIYPDIVATLSAQIDQQLAIHGNAVSE
jgi:arylsulfatase A-like enzyme